MVTKKKNKEPVPKRKCITCQEEKRYEFFYKAPEDSVYSDGYFPFCKQCLKDSFQEETIENMKDILQRLDMPFMYDIWLSAVKSKGVTLGTYLRILGFRQYKGMAWKDSIFEPSEERQEEAEELKREQNKNKFIVTDEIINRWGEGYQPEEYRAFERKYNKLKDNYPERTSMHSEALYNYIRYRCKEEISTADGKIKEAEAWGKLAQKAAQDAKINPSQLSKADLQDGLSTFGELSRAVESAKDIIPILPKFKEKPRDKVDINIWVWANYVRDLKGLPPASYEEIYKFYETRKKEYESHLDVEDMEVF